MLAEIYVEIDDFCKEYGAQISKRIEGIPFWNKLFTRRKLSSKVHLSEVMTVLIYYHYSQYRHFKAYYEKVVLVDFKKDFPDLPSYSGFVWWIPLAILPLLLFVHWRNSQSQRSGVYYIDSTKIAVCDKHRVHQNKVFKGFAAWGKTSMGWFYGFKLHLLVNQQGELMASRFTPGNVADNDMHLLYELSEQVVNPKQSAWIFGDKGYLCQASKKAVLEEDGRVIFCAKPRKNQKNAKQWYKDLPLLGRLWGKKRGLIESVIGIHKDCFDLEHTRHRSMMNAFAHMYAALAAYHFRPKKPSTNIKIEAHLIEQTKEQQLKIAA